MSNEELTTPAEPQKSVANNDWAALLSSEDIANLTGFFDVLIEMDFEQKQRNEERNQNEATAKSSANSKP